MTTPSPADGLRECPFCGGEAALTFVEQFGGFVSCLTEGCAGYAHAAQHDRDKIIANWNRRTDATALRLREGCESSARKWSVVRQFASGDDFDRWEDMARGSHIPSDAGNEYADDRADDLARILEEGE